MRRSRFLGVPCSRCGGVERYVSDHACVVCKLEQSKARRIAATKARKAAGTSKTYRGKACRACGSRIRLRSNARCLACSRDDYRRANQHRQRRTYPRREALAQGRRVYIGKPCPHGHDGTRYAISGCCIECVKAMGRRRLTKKGRAHVRELERARERRRTLAVQTCEALGIPI
jgi:hypothetical protein